jgi:hypothetical protein
MIIEAIIYDSRLQDSVECRLDVVVKAMQCVYKHPLSLSKQHGMDSHKQSIKHSPHHGNARIRHPNLHHPYQTPSAQQHGSACAVIRVAAEIMTTQERFLSGVPNAFSLHAKFKVLKRSKVQRAVNIQNAPRAPVRFMAAGATRFGLEGRIGLACHH